MAKHVLVVDDEPLIALDTASMLEELGCEVLTAATGAEALKRLAQDPRIEVLITDINMPEMDGYELAARAKCVQKRSASDPVIRSRRSWFWSPADPQALCKG